MILARGRIAIIVQQHEGWDLALHAVRIRSEVGIANIKHQWLWLVVVHQSALVESLFAQVVVPCAHRPYA